MLLIYGLIVNMNNINNEISVRDLVRFKSKSRDDGEYIVREIRMNNKAMIENIKDKDEYYIVDIDDIHLSNNVW